jgi:hypothetical protein
MVASMRRQSMPVLSLLVGGLLVFTISMVGSPGDLLAALPGLILFCTLCFDRYLGHELIERLAERLGYVCPRRRREAEARWRPLRCLRLILTLLATVRTLRGPPQLSPLSL